MYGDEHRRITELAIEALGRSSSEPAVGELLRFACELLAFSSLPDTQPEYERTLVPDEAMFVKSKLVRVPHHTCPSYHILRKLLKVRAALLRGRLGEKEVRQLGYALHYLQDRCVPSPKHGNIHSYIERSLHEGLNGFLLGCPLEAPEVRGYKQLSGIVRKQVPSGDPRLAARCAMTMTYAALYAVFANPVRAYPEFMEKARAFHEAMLSWRGSAYAMLATGGLSLDLILFLRCIGDIVLLGRAEPTSVIVSLLMAFPFPIALFIFTLALLSAFARSRTTMLRRLYIVTSEKSLTLSAIAVCPLILSAPLTLAPLAIGALLVLVEALPLLSRSFRAIRAEIPWFQWDE